LACGLTNTKAEFFNVVQESFELAAAFLDKMVAPAVAANYIIVMRTRSVGCSKRKRRLELFVHILCILHSSTKFNAENITYSNLLGDSP